MNSPAMRTVSTKWAAEFIGKNRDTSIKTLLRNNDLSSSRERREASIGEGELSWWEMVRLDAYEHLKTKPAKSNRRLRQGLLLLSFRVEPFLVVWEPSNLPVLIDHDQLLRYQVDMGASAVYEPNELFHALGLEVAAPPQKRIATDRQTRVSPRTEQTRLFGTGDQLDLFGED